MAGDTDGARRGPREVQKRDPERIWEQEQQFETAVGNLTELQREAQQEIEAAQEQMRKMGAKQKEKDDKRSQVQLRLNTVHVFQGAIMIYSMRH